MKNIKFKYDRKEPSEIEIASAKKFDEVLSKAIDQSGLSAVTKIYLSAFALVAAVLIIWLIFPKEEKTNNKSTPLAEIDVEKTSFMIFPDQENKLEYFTGSVIHIPANAFTDEEGNIIEGEVIIHYREFHHLAEILISGIPMTYESAGTQYHFETAGMFEISGMQNNEPVFIHPQKRITVEMASGNEGDYFNQYFLDTNAGNWNYLGKDIAKKRTADNTELSSDLKTFGTSAGQKDKPIEPKKENPNFYSFEIVFNEEEFPELNVYKGLKFQVDKNEKNFSEEFARIAWENATIARGTKEGEYLITLNKGGEHHSFNCIPVVAEKDYQTARAQYEKLFIQYKEKERSRLKKEEEKEKNMLDKQEKFEKELFEKQRRQTEELRRISEIYQTEKTVIRTFEISQFGIWNSDCPHLLPKGQSILASYTNERGESIKIQKIFLVERNKNALFAYSNPEKLQFDPMSENILIAITDENRVCVFDHNDFKDMDTKAKSQTIRMRGSSHQIKTVNDIIRLLDV